MQLTVKHTTDYLYDAPVDFALQKVRLRPASCSMQTVQDWNVEIIGGKIETSYSDHYGNHIDLVSAEAGTQKLSIVAQGTVATNETHGVFGRVYGRAPIWHFKQSTPLTASEASIATLSKIVEAHDTALDGLHALSAAILEAVPYEAGHTDALTSAGEALSIGKAVCQDHAHIFISAAREAGLAARYVSGYLMMNDRVDQDASHAWAEVHLDGLGWVCFDVSNGVAPDERYVRLAIGRDAHDAAPVSGLRRGAGDESMSVSLQVQQ